MLVSGQNFLGDKMPQHRKSIDQHLANGTYRPSVHGDKDNVPDPEEINEIPRPPTFLGKYGKKEFKRLCQGIQKMGILSSVDFGVIEAAAMEYDNWRTIIDKIVELNEGQRKGAIANYLEKKKTQQSATLTAELRKCSDGYLQAVYKLGVSPVERSRIQLPSKKEDNNSALGAI